MYIYIFFYLYIYIYIYTRIYVCVQNAMLPSLFASLLAILMAVVGSYRNPKVPCQVWYFLCLGQGGLFLRNVQKCCVLKCMLTNTTP